MKKTETHLYNLAEPALFTSIRQDKFKAFAICFSLCISLGKFSWAFPVEYLVRYISNLALLHSKFSFTETRDMLS